MEELWQMKPIGFMKSVFHFKNGTPRQPSVCNHARGSITIEKSVFNNPEHSLEGLEQFTHVWIMFLFHKNNNAHTKAKVRPPRLDGGRAGVFSTRSPYRPNAVGLTLAAIDKIHGATVFLRGIDILDGTPILDIKPYIPDYDVPGDISGSAADLIESGEIAGKTKKYELKGKVSDDISQSSITNCDNMQMSDGLNEAVTVSEQLVEEIYSDKTPSNNVECSKDSLSTEEIPSSTLSGHSTSREVTPAGSIDRESISTGVNDDEVTDKQCLNNRTDILKSVKTASWVSEKTKTKKISVRFTSTASTQLQTFSTDHADENYKLNLFQSSSEVESAIHQVLNEDPRSVYRRNKCKDSLYFFSIDTVHVTCWFDNHLAEVVRVQPVTLVPQCTTQTV